MFIDGFGISEYRSFGTEIQRIGPLKKINFFIGQNNSGKSNILSFLCNHWPSVKTGTFELKFEPLDRHIGESNGEFFLEIGLIHGGANLQGILSKYNEKLTDNSLSLLERLFKSDSLKKNKNLIWFRYQGTWSQSTKMKLSHLFIEEVFSSKILSEREWYYLWTFFFQDTKVEVSEKIGSLMYLKN